jgi:hypothetical protein
MKPTASRPERPAHRTAPRPDILASNLLRDHIEGNAKDWPPASYGQVADTLERHNPYNPLAINFRRWAGRVG